MVPNAAPLAAQLTDRRSSMTHVAASAPLMVHLGEHRTVHRASAVDGSGRRTSPLMLISPNGRSVLCRCQNAARTKRPRIAMLPAHGQYKFKNGTEPITATRRYSRRNGLPLRSK
jgi:hypothetical protein